MITQWWAAKTYTTPVVKIDFRVGGQLLYCMRSPDGQDTWGKGIYKEIVRPGRIVVTDSFADPLGNTVPAVILWNTGGNAVGIISDTYI